MYPNAGFAGGVYGSTICLSTSSADTFPANVEFSDYPDPSVANPSLIFSGYNRTITPGLNGSDRLSATFPVMATQIVITANTTYRLTSSTQVTAGSYLLWGAVFAQRIA